MSSSKTSKPLALSSKHYTKEELEIRQANEDRLKGQSDKIKPPSYLNKNQKKIFKYIVEQLEASGILSNLDIYILADCCVSLDRIESIDRMINEDPKLLSDRKLLTTRKDCENAFFRCCSELCLTPQGRAKLVGINFQAQQDSEDPLLKALRDEDE